MVKDLLAGTSFATYAEIALVLFVLVFASVAVRAWLLKPHEAERFAALPIDDGEPTDEF